MSSREVTEQLVDLLRHQHGGRLVEDEDAGAAVEHLEDLDALPVADAEVLDQLVGVDVEAVGLRDLADPAARGAESAGRRCAARLPRTTFSSTVRLSASMKCWCTMPMPAAIASAGEWKRHLLAVDADRALVRALHAVQDLHQRGLARAVLARRSRARCRGGR